MLLPVQTLGNGVNVEQVVSNNLAKQECIFCCRKNEETQDRIYVVLVWSSEVSLCRTLFPIHAASFMEVVDGEETHPPPQNSS